MKIRDSIIASCFAVPIIVLIGLAFLTVTGYDTPLFLRSASVRSIDGMLPAASFHYDITTTAVGVETAIATTLPGELIGVTIINYSPNEDLYIQFDGTAAETTIAYIPPGNSLTVPGTGTQIALISMKGETSVPTGIFTHVITP